MTIASEITRIKTNIENAYTKAGEKGATMPELLNSEGLAGCIESIPKSSGGTEDAINIPEGYSRVRFLDFDGTVLSEQILEDLVDITDIPTPPEHEYLEFDYWNWDFGKDETPYVKGHMDIGAIYKPIDNKTYVGINLTEDTGLSVEYSLVSIRTPMNTAKPELDSYIMTYTIDFGDGTVENFEHTFSKSTSSTFMYEMLPNFSHTYSSYGEYVISIKSTSKTYDEEQPTYNNFYLDKLVFLNKKVLATSFENREYYYYQPEVKFLYMNYATSWGSKYLDRGAFCNLEKAVIYIPFIHGYYNELDEYVNNPDNFKMASWNGNRNFLIGTKVKHINFVDTYADEIQLGTLCPLETVSLGNNSVICNSFLNLKEIVLNIEKSAHKISAFYTPEILKIYNLDKPHVITKGDRTLYKNPYFVEQMGSNNGYANLKQKVVLTQYGSIYSNTVEDITCVLGGNGSGYTPNLYTPNLRKLTILKNEKFDTESSYGLQQLPKVEIAYNLCEINCDTSFNTEEINQYTFKNSRVKRLDFNSMYPKAKKMSVYSLENNCYLEEVNFPENCELDINGYFLQYARKIKKITGMNNVMTSSSSLSNCFSNCHELEDLDLSNFTSTNTSVTFNSLFYYDYKLKNIKMPTNMNYTFQSYNFNGCYALEELSLDGLIGITSSSSNFADCINLKKVWIPSTCTTISASSSSDYSLHFKNCNPNLIIYTDATSKPSGWGTYWNYINSNTPLQVYWGATKENYENGDPIPS